MEVSEKTLGWFKFNPANFINSDLALIENYHIQGLYMQVVCFYWQRKGEVPLSTLKAKFSDEEKDIEYLINKNHIKEKKSKVCIDWLDKEIKAAMDRIRVSKKAASTRWNAQAMPGHYGSNAKAMPKEKKIKEEKRKEKNRIRIQRQQEENISLKESEDLEVSIFIDDREPTPQECSDYFKRNGWPESSSENFYFYYINQIRCKELEDPADDWRVAADIWVQDETLI